MSQRKKEPKTTTRITNMLPLLSFNQIISLVILLLVTSLTTQTPSSSYICPTDCECKLDDFSARCENLDSLIASYSKKYASRRLMPIKSLDLSNNELTKISNQLEVLVNLTELNLSHNRLTQVRKFNFQHLEKLDLSHNQITSGKLSKLPKNIVSLNLAHNQITYLPVDFMKLKKLRTLDIHENPLNCTCETLHVRNWMSYQNVWSSKVIICTAPQIVKGQPWLQARQGDICFEPSSTTMRSVKDTFDDFDSNNIMMGDQPHVDHDEDTKDVEYDEKSDNEFKNDEDDNDDTKNIFDEEVQQDDEKQTTDDDYDDSSKKDELEKEYLKVKEENTSVEPPHASDKLLLTEEDEDASGHGALPIMMANKEQIVEESEDDGSGSGSGILPDIPIIVSSSEKPNHEDDSYGSDSDETTFVPLLIPGVQKGKTGDSNKPPVETVPDVATPDKEVQLGNIQSPSTEDNTGTYILLLIIGVLLISLIIFVALKNRKEKRQARRRYDVENKDAKELQDMNKSLLSKPIEKNGNGKHAENSPLINGDHKDDYKPFKAPSITVDEPIQELPHQKEKSQQSLYDTPNGNGALHEPVHTSPSNGSVSRSPDSDEEVFHPASDTPHAPGSMNVSPEPPKRYSPVYPPVSPRSARYSPVYSPETGRVKIKLTETPKPKTPVVVTRSRSRAGDYINTPNDD